MLINIKRNAEVFGPYSVEEAREYLSSGRLLLSDLAELPGTMEWIPLASVPGVRIAPPPPPPSSADLPGTAPGSTHRPLLSEAPPVLGVSETKQRPPTYQTSPWRRAIKPAGVAFGAVALGWGLLFHPTPMPGLSLCARVLAGIFIGLFMAILPALLTYLLAVLVYGRKPELKRAVDLDAFETGEKTRNLVSAGVLTAIAVLCVISVSKPGREAWSFAWCGADLDKQNAESQQERELRKIQNTAGKPVVERASTPTEPNPASQPGVSPAGDAAEPDAKAQAAAEFERDFFQIYPDLKPYRAVVDAVATKLGEQGFTAPTREAVMEAFAKGARKEIKRQQQSALPPGAMVLKGDWGNTPRMTDATTPEWVKAGGMAQPRPSTEIRFTGKEPGHAGGPPIQDTSLAGDGTGDMPDWVRHSPGYVQSAWQQCEEVNAFNKNAAERDGALREREQALREQQVEDAKEAARARAQSLEAAAPQPAWQVRPENPPPAVPQVKSGTGFFITDDGYFLTCCHVIKDASRISIRLGQAFYQAALVRADPQNDLALLKVSGRFRSLPVAPPKSVKLGDSVFTIGFPNVDLQGFEPKLTKGDVSSLAGGRDNPLYFQISVPVQPGNSGGALVNTVGNVVGIVSDRLSDSAALETTGMLAQNVNYAVKCDSVTAFLGALPEVLAKLKSPNRSKDRKSEDVLKEAKDATALVIASDH